MKIVLLTDKVEPEEAVAVVEDHGTSGFLEAYGKDREDAIEELKRVVTNRIKLLQEIDFDRIEVREV